MTPEQRDDIERAICDANMKCDDDTGLYDVQPGCKARQAASRAWLWVTGAGMALTAYDAAEARAEAAEAEAARLREAMQEAVNYADHEMAAMRKARAYGNAHAYLHKTADMLRAILAGDRGAASAGT